MNSSNKCGIDWLDNDLRGLLTHGGGPRFLTYHYVEMNVAKEHFTIEDFNLYFEKLQILFSSDEIVATYRGKRSHEEVSREIRNGEVFRFITPVNEGMDKDVPLVYLGWNIYQSFEIRL